MPRLAPSLTRRFNKHLRLLLPPNHGVVEDARAELSWIKEYHAHRPDLVTKSCLERSRFVPLQYILKSQPFGALDIECRPGVLIPRWETEEWSTLVLQEIKQKWGPNKVLKILDLCTGSGCVALNIANGLGERKARISGLDIAGPAIELSRKNLEKNKALLSDNVEVNFVKTDLFDDAIRKTIRNADVITMNPPYILQEEAQLISLSTRRYEPHTALIPGPIGSGEIFYERVIDILDCRPQDTMVAFEIGSKDQADRVAHMIHFKLGWHVDIWQDSAGKARCVFARSWIKKESEKKLARDLSLSANIS